ncbi:MAG: phenylalanine--tRNA ligase subunit beta [Kiritimatiellae bacterium]|jgi:phenylalanyl-tRNA synthetase beta chain|nr:phenylalanine--tRNA ligase subunit beta [Kiritimatiellia bacterium]
MKVPVSWLNEYVEVSDLSVQELSDKLTFSGIEVEGIESVGADLDDKFVVGEVLTCVPHENSDHLSVCSVSDGMDEYQVVCGAPNCRAGIKVPFAKVGAVIPDGGFKIKKAKLRGVLSFGMLCSASELNISEESDGIMILESDPATGTPVRELLPPPEIVLDLEVTWNRPDCLSIIGVAREFAALLKRPLKMPSLDFTESGEPVEKYVKVSIETPEMCSRYTARILTEVKDGASPLWMQQRLELCGVRAISLTVDVTNYVMLEMGQPLHAFDYRKLAGQSVVVRCAQDGEIMETLDGVKRTLDSSMLVIADAKDALAVAGIMGGAESEIAAGSEHVLLESALFDPVSTKFTAASLGLATESSRRFERGVDLDLADLASRRATSLLAEHGGAKVAVGVIDCDLRDFKNQRTPLRFDRARQVIGVDISDDAMIEILRDLGLIVESNSGGSAVFVIPSYRLDLTLEADLIEEIARMKGFDNIPGVVLESGSVSTLDDGFFYDRKRCREVLTGFGFTESMHYSFLSAGELDAFDKRSSEFRAVIPNPVSGDFGVLRDSLLPQMAASLGRNASRQVESAALFEMGRVFAKNSEGVFSEEERVSLGIMGPFGRTEITRRTPVSNEEALLWIKGAVENLVNVLHAGNVNFKLNDHPAMEEGWGVDIILNKKVIGCMGLVTAKLRHQWRMTLPMPMAELKLEPLLAGVNKVPAVKPVPAYPAVNRDIAFISDSSITHRDVVKCIRKAGSVELTKIAIFDIFISKEIGKGKRSLGYTLSFRSLERTLTDHEVNESFTKIIQALKDDLKVDVREA